MLWTNRVIEVDTFVNNGVEYCYYGGDDDDSYAGPRNKSFSSASPWRLRPWWVILSVSGVRKKNEPMWNPLILQRVFRRRSAKYNHVRVRVCVEASDGMIVTRSIGGEITISVILLCNCYTIYT